MHKLLKKQTFGLNNLMEVSSNILEERLKVRRENGDQDLENTDTLWYMMNR